jgi:hypothetical protein
VLPTRDEIASRKVRVEVHRARAVVLIRNRERVEQLQELVLEGVGEEVIPSWVVVSCAADVILAHVAAERAGARGVLVLALMDGVHVEAIKALGDEMVDDLLIVTLAC